MPAPGTTADEPFASTRAPVRPHPVLLLVVLATVTAGAVFAPVLAGMTALGGSILFRLVDGTAGYAERRRQDYGRRRSDLPMVAGALPWHLLRAAVATLLTLPQAVLGSLAAGAVVLATTSGLRPRVQSASFDRLTAALVAGALLAAVYGPGSLGLRRGFYRVGRRLAPSRLAGLLVGAALLCGAGLLVWSALDERPLTTPFHSTPEPFASVVDYVRGW